MTPSTPDRYRPGYHFSPRSGWANDPNGMVYFAGEYHLFYQHYPHEPRWGGPMHWGHAVSPNLIDWQHLPIALEPDELGTIYSGCVVVDWHNTAGFGSEALVAIFTHHNDDGHIQSQSLAYSLDRGRTWHKYAHNPVLAPDPALRDFRDPRVFWHGDEVHGHWVMCVAAGRHVRFYRSPDLKRWTFCSSFGFDHGSTFGVWECPDLFELPLEGSDQSHWVLIISVGDGGVAGGTAQQVFIGKFDGHTFINSNPPDQTLWLDYGPDAYAGQSWGEAPDGERYFISWMANWRYAPELPTNEWRGGFTLPRQLYLFQTEAGPRVGQRPLTALQALRETQQRRTDLQLNANTSHTQPLTSRRQEIRLTLSWSEPAPQAFGLHLSFGTEEQITLTYDPQRQQLTLDRRQAGLVDFHPDFAGLYSAPLETPSRSLTLHLFLDHASLELFAQDGRLIMSQLLFPTSAQVALEVFTRAQPLLIQELTCFSLRSARFTR